MMKKTLFLLCVILLACSSVSLAHAQTNGGQLQYTPLEPIPGTVDSSGHSLGLNDILNFAFKALFSFGGLIAVFALIYGGIVYMTSEMAGKKEEAKKRIRGAIYGLGLLLVSYLILNTINPQLLQFNLDFGALTQPSAPSANSGDSQGTGNGSASQEVLQVNLNKYTIKLYNNDTTNSQTLMTANQTKCNNHGIRAINGGTDSQGDYTIFQCL